MLTIDIINYYVNLLVIQYNNLPNAQLTIQALATEVVADQIIAQVRDGFSIDTAVGNQLNIIGEYVGAPRNIFGYDPTIPYFAFPAYAGTPAPNTGFAQYSDTTDPPDLWLSYTTGSTQYTLTDGQLRDLIRYLIAVHMSDHTIFSIDNILQTFFGIYCTLADNQDMTITYTHQLSDPNFLFSIINELNLLPHPAGVQVSVVEV